MLRRRNVLGGNEVFRQTIFLSHVFASRRHCVRIDQVAITQQLVRENIHFLFALLALANDVAEVVVREARLDAIAGVVGQRQRNRARRCDRTVVREARADLRELPDKHRIFLGNPLHIAAVAGVQNSPGHFVADLVTITDHLRTPGQHRRRHLELLVHDRRRSFFLGQLQSGFPTNHRQLLCNIFGERHRFRRAVLHSQHRDRGAEPEEAHAVTALAIDLVLLPWQRQSVDLDHIVQHARKDADDFAECFPVETRVLGKRINDKFRQIDRSEQAGPVRRQWLLTAGVRRTNILGEPVVVHLVDLVDQHEARLCEIVGRRHDQIPHPLGGQRPVDLARHLSAVVLNVVACLRPVAPDELRCIANVEIVLLDFLLGHRKGEVPVLLILDGLHELVGDEERQIELPQPAVFSLRANEVDCIRVPDVKRSHLRAPSAAGGRHCETHAVVDIHERQRAGRVCTSTRYVGALRSQGRELVANAASRLQRETGFMNLVQDVVHRIADRAGHGAIDGRSRRFMLASTRVRHDASRRYRSVAQRPDKLFEILFALRFVFDVSKCACDTAVSVVDRPVDNLATLCHQAVFRRPYVE